MHRDLKPANLLLSHKVPKEVYAQSSDSKGFKQRGSQQIAMSELLHNLTLKIGDFGLSKAQEFPLQQMTKEIMTLWYRAPEVILNNLSYSPVIDLWSAGVIIFQMLTGEVMFAGNSDIDMIFRIFNLKGTPISEEQSQK